MSTDNRPSAVARSYADAYASHYTERDLLVALRSYQRVIAQHPGAPEAEYSRAQILNIVNLVVPAGELLTAQVQLAVRCLEPHGDDSTTVVTP